MIITRHDDYTRVRVATMEHPRATTTGRARAMIDSARAARATDESSTRRSLVRDLRRGRLHDDHLRLLLPRHRSRGLPRVHLSAHLALQTRAATHALEAFDRLRHPHAKQRVLQDGLGVARVTPDAPIKYPMKHVP